MIRDVFVAGQTFDQGLKRLNGVKRVTEGGGRQRECPKTFWVEAKVQRQ